MAKEKAKGDDLIRLRLRLEGIVLPEPDLSEGEIKRLTDEQEEEVNRILFGGRDEELLVQGDNPIHRRDIKTLHGLKWLNDEVRSYTLYD